MRHPFDFLLDAWQRAGGADSIELRKRVYSALRLRREWTQPRVRATLRAILCADRDQQLLFDRVFASAFTIAPEAAPPPNNTVGEHRTQVEPSAPTVPPRVGAAPVDPTLDRPSAWRLTVKPLLVVSLAGLIVAAPWFAPVTTTDHKAKVAQTAVVTPRVSNQPASGPSASKEVPVPPGFAQTRPPAWPWWKPRRIGLLILAGFSLAVALLSAAWAIAVAVRARVRFPAVGRATPHIAAPGPDLDLRARERAKPIRRRDLSKTAYSLGGIVAEQSGAIDIEATVEATARVGTLQIAHHRCRREPKISVFVASELDPVATQALQHFFDGMRRLGADLQRISHLPNKYDQDATLIVVNSKELSRDGFGRLLFSRNVSLVESRDTSFWGREIDALPNAPQPLTSEGLQAALRAALRGHAKTSKRLTIATDERERMGSALPLAVAAALIQPLDLRTLDRLRRAFAPKLPFIALQRILHASGAIVDEQQIRFEDAFLPRWSELVEPSFKAQVLKWNLETRLRVAKTPERSRARLMQDRETALTMVQLVALGQSVPEEELEMHLGRLEQQDAGDEIRERLATRVAELKAWLGERVNLDAIQLPQALRSRIGRLFKLAGVRIRLSRTERTLVTVLATVSVLLATVSGSFALSATHCPSGKTPCGKACIPDNSVCDACGGACDQNHYCALDGASQAPACHPLCGVAACASGQTCVGDVCLERCGDAICKSGEICDSGKCATECNGKVCNSGEACCDSGCTGVGSDFANCGTCGTRCAPTMECDDGKCQTASRKDCSTTSDCSARGLCTTRGLKCVASSDAECKNATDCAEHGRCSAQNGQCVAIAEKDCRESKDCRANSLCQLQNGVCTDNATFCKNSPECASRGNCAWIDGGCRPGDAKDCAASADCKKNGVCGIYGTKCIVTVAGCGAAEVCMNEGHCTFKDEQCVLADPADCSKSFACMAEGRCSIVGGRCAPKTDAECRKSTVCTTNSRCWVRDGQCAELRQADPL